MAAGVSLKMPNTCYIEDNVEGGSDTVIWVLATLLALLKLVKLHN